MAKLTKEQFIKRVEKITNFKLWNEASGMNNVKVFWFRGNYAGQLDLTISNSGIMFESGMNPRFIPNEWLIPLGKAIKEYYGK